MAANAVCFFIAAVMETQKGNEEKYIENQKTTALEGAGKGRQMLVDIKEGLRYLAGEKGMLAVTVYFAVLFTMGGIENVITLPYFKSSFTNGEYIYMLVMLGAFLGEAIGGLASEFIGERMIIMIAMLIQAVLAVIIIGGNRESISAIYNREQ